ncbi:beta-galactosidase, partial [Bacillaceae bacterium Marseille-Q3522]|nr:beta-galactosidase [Bacillaceae bacterium Marseille-Q3522]
MIELKERQIIIDGKPQLIMSGEIHYFRLNKENWLDRIMKLKNAGCNTVASYVPWLCHEPIEGRVDLEGKTRPELDLGAFIDLCMEQGLMFILRPGPFIMAELKNEGIPHWIYNKYPNACQVGWDNKGTTTAALNYLHTGFLQETKKWYKTLMDVVLSRLHCNGGNIIAIQLDNEIGMLQWVSNSPDLTDETVNDFVRWLNIKYSK